MGFFGKLFGRAPKMGRMEAYIADLSPSSMVKTMRTVKESRKVPMAQALALLLFCDAFAKGLRKSANAVPEFMRTDWPFPYEKVITEAAGFYYYFMIKDYLSTPDDDDEGDDVRQDDPYFEALKMSLQICGALIHELSDKAIPEKFVANRAVSYSSIQRRRDGDVIASLQAFIMKAWNPKDDGRPVLELSSPVIPILSSTVSMPFEAVRDVCRELYDQKMRDPKAY